MAKVWLLAIFHSLAGSTPGCGQGPGWLASRRTCPCVEGTGFGRSTLSPSHPPLLLQGAQECHRMIRAICLLCLLVRKSLPLTCPVTLLPHLNVLVTHIQMPRTGRKAIGNCLQHAFQKQSNLLEEARRTISLKQGLAIRGLNANASCCICRCLHFPF